MKITGAVVREKSGPFIIEELDLDEPRENEVLVEIVGSGVCHTDILYRDQSYPIPLPVVLGHEGSGIVRQIGSHVSKVSPGDHVILTFSYCGTCASCRKGFPAYCLNFPSYNLCGTRTDGSTTMQKGQELVYGCFLSQSSFASHVLATERNTVKVRDDVPLELLGPLGCSIQTGAGGVINSLHAEAGSSIAIFGIGPVGLAAVMAAVVCGCTIIIVVDFNNERLQFAEQLGATHTINPSQNDPVEAIHDITSSGVDYSLDCVGIPEVSRQAVDSLTVLGVSGLIGGSPVGTQVTLDMNNVLSGRAFRGIIMGDSIPDIFIPRLIELFRAGRFPIDRLIKFYNLKEINEAVTDAGNGLILKAILRP
jgi:aryl-alcohol dehydrogenase